MGAPTRIPADSSRSSIRSMRSGYRRLAPKSTVDESLFSPKQRIGQPVLAVSQTGAEILPNNDKGHSTSVSAANQAYDTVALTKGELQRMLRPADILTPDQLARRRREVEERRERERAQATARKAAMLKLEEERKKHEPPTESEALKSREDEATRSYAEALLEEERDEVKHMNQMVMYGKCVTIRDAQIAERKHMMAEEEAAERRLDLQMEVDRIRALEAVELREKQKEEERKRGAAILAEQIAERQRERIRVEELREQERLQMTREIERLREEERGAAAAKVRAAEALMEEVVRSNADQISRKREAAAADAADDAAIAAYIRQRDLREQALAEEKLRAAKEKELETARLRAQQERAADRQSEVDELRARRYQEEYERQNRTKELAERQRIAAINSDLAQARKAQQAAQVRAQADMAAVEAAEFQRVLEENRVIEEQKARQAAIEAEIRRRHKEELMAQIAANEERSRREREEYLQEAQRLRERLEQEKLLIEAIRQRKLREMEENGVPAKYRAELAKKKLGPR